jgi:hypothetical protein
MNALSSASPSEPTKSELLFERFCREHAIDYKRIPRAEGKRTPDYEFYPSGVRIVVEVAQLDPNDGDRQYSRKRDDGSFVGVGGTIGQRIRQKITDKADQLKAWTKGMAPTILVVYNNTDVRSYTRPEHVCSAMFGFQTFVMDVPADPSKPSSIVDRKRGRGSRMTTGQNTSVSAVAVLEEDSTDHLTMRIYHNHHAVNRIAPCVLKLENVEQYGLGQCPPGQMPTWFSM